MKRTVRTLQKFLEAKSFQCIHAPSGNLKHDYVTPTYAIIPGSDDEAMLPKRSELGHYLQMYDWDAYFFCQATPKLEFNGLRMSVLSNFLDLQDDQGYIPRTVAPLRIWDRGDLCKPFLCQLLNEYFLHSTNGGAQNSLSDQMLNKLERYLAHVESNRRTEFGLYRWRNVLESGVDNNLSLLAPEEAAKDENLSVGHFPDSTLSAVDLNCYLIKEYEAFSQIALLAGKFELAKQYADKAKVLCLLVEDTLWDERIGMYANHHPASGHKIPVRSWTGLLPVLLGCAAPERVEVVIEKNIASKEHFLRPCGLSSLSYSEPIYNQARRGLYGRVVVSNWKGPLWVLPNVLAVRCLLKWGKVSLAEEIANRVVKTLSQVVWTSNTLFENYSAESGEPLWAPQFISWNILALELIELVA